MLKVTYTVPSVFSIKKFNDSHLAARSYEYPMLTTIRGAILGSVIERKGRLAAEKIFRKLKNIQIFIQYPNSFTIGQQKIKRMSNKGYEYKYSEESKGDWEGKYTVGIREYVYTDKIVFYIDESIDDIIEYLVNIDRIGDSESLVMLESIEKVTEMENVLVEWNESIGYDTRLYELYDWETKLNKKGDKDSGMNFEDVYIFSENKKAKYIKRLCYIKDKIVVSGILLDNNGA
ncbi:MAG: type I-A CRISPR-associated protein Cas5a [Paeniclostridium sordellii]|nr:type I-A CRISPR-associated protein Cas5a [Paeniclostridium sordellii]